MLSKNETHFYNRATYFQENLLKMWHYFPKWLSFQANFINYGIRLMKLDLFLRQFKKSLKMWHKSIPVFALNKRVIIIPGGWFWDPCISAARPRIDLCTMKSPPPAIDHDERNTLYLSKIKTLIFFQHVQLGLISLIFLCSDKAYVLK